MNKVCRKLNPVTAFAGNLAKRMVTWRQITSDPWVLESVSGYHLEFENDMIPIQSSLPIPPMLNQHEESIMNNEAEKLVTKDAIEKHPYISQRLKIVSFLMELNIVPI